MRSQGQADSGDAPMLESEGNNVAAFLDYVLRHDRKRFDEIETALAKLIPGFERLAIPTPDPNTRRIDLIVDQGFKMEGQGASAGLRLLLFFVAMAYHPKPPKIILLEEPESGVHPKRLADVIRLLREITKGLHGKNAAQVVLSTHSPYLLDLIDPSTDQVLVFRRNDDGSRSAEPVDAERLKGFLDEFMLGEIWYNQGEDGLVARKSP